MTHAQRLISVPVMMLITFSMLSFSITSQADEFTAKNLKDWEVAFQSAVKDGRAAFTDPKLGTNGVVCAQCHPNAANTHPETYPKYQKQLGHVAPIWEMINWCIQNPLEGKKLAADDKVMLALQAYITSERKGVKLDPGKH